MKDAHRKYLIAGNWKMNKNTSEGVDLAKDIAEAVGSQLEVQVVICPPFTGLHAIGAAVADSNLHLGAQNLHPEPSGAFTGEVSAEMLRSLYASFVIIGHSERRTLFGETDDFVNAKVLTAIRNSLKPILCVGETLEERESNSTLDVVSRQVRAGLAGVDAESADQIVIAYEPVWAIGTGKTATPAMAQEVHAAIRSILAELLDKARAERIRILYGGSMKPDNAAELLSEKDIDGGLIGGASLKARDFCEIVKAASKLAS